MMMIVVVMRLTMFREAAFRSSLWQIWFQVSNAVSPQPHLKCFNALHVEQLRIFSSVQFCAVANLKPILQSKSQLVCLLRLFACLHVLHVEQLQSFTIVIYC